MNNTIYRELFSFSYWNSFYLNGRNINSYNAKFTEDFTVFLTSDTQKILQQFGLIYTKVAGGFKIMAQVDQTLPAVVSLVKKVDLKSKLTFYLKLSNPSLLGFSDVANKELANGANPIRHVKSIKLLEVYSTVSDVLFVKACNGSNRSIDGLFRPDCLHWLHGYDFGCIPNSQPVCKIFNVG